MAGINAVRMRSTPRSRREGLISSSWINKSPARAEGEGVKGWDGGFAMQKWWNYPETTSNRGVY